MQLTNIKNKAGDSFSVDMGQVRLIQPVVLANNEIAIKVRFNDGEYETMDGFCMDDVTESLCATRNLIVVPDPTAVDPDADTDFTVPQNPPAWAEHDNFKPYVPNPIEFKKVAWMKIGDFNVRGDELYVILCFIGGEPIDIPGFTSPEAIALVAAWEAYRVGKPIEVEQ